MKSILSIENLKEAIDKQSWDLNISRIDRNINLILNLLEEKNTKATFFVLGWIAERYPEIIKKIYLNGHEIACHGYNHELVYKLTQKNFQQDVYRAKSILENIIGDKVTGYRAPSFSITDWAFDTLIQLGFQYDSSLFLTFAPHRYGKLSNIKIPRKSVFELRDGFYEVMLSYYDIGGIRVPWSGGFYFRFIPYKVFKFGINRILKKKDIYLFYIHPWEFDPEQPRIRNIKMNYRLRHYINLKRTESKFKMLINDFNYCPIREVIPNLSRI
jgi:polysaccharide deacetylase family protein (PEP-CTERM system associated)